MRYADDGVVLCRSREQAEAALGVIEQTLGELGLRRHPGRPGSLTRVTVEKALTSSAGTFGAACPAGGEARIRRCYLHRWRSQRAMKAIRAKIRDRTGRNRVGVRDLRVLFTELNPSLRGWGNHFRTGNSAKKFNQIDSCLRRCPVALLVKRRGRNRRVGQVQRWTADGFRDQGVFSLRGTVRYPKAA